MFLPATLVKTALALAALPGAGGARRSAAGGAGPALAGTAQAFTLACGYLFVVLSRQYLDGLNALLFGSVLSVTSSQVATLAAVTAAVAAALAVIGRPLLFASLDPAAAAARGVPVRLLSTVFLALLGAAAADATEIAGVNLRGLAIAIYFFSVNIAAYLIGSNLIGHLNDRFGATADPAMMRYALLVCPIACLASAICLFAGGRTR